MSEKNIVTVCLRNGPFHGGYVNVEYGQAQIVLMTTIEEGEFSIVETGPEKQKKRCVYEVGTDGAPGGLMIYYFNEELSSIVS